MISFNFNIDNAFVDRWITLFCKSGLLAQHKAWELNGYRTHHLINSGFKLTTKGDHAGVQFELGVFGYSIEFQIYDTRHWDYENNQWENYEKS
jgi:hypothetical protein